MGGAARAAAELKDFPPPRTLAFDGLGQSMPAFFSRAQARARIAGAAAARVLAKVRGDYL